MSAKRITGLFLAFIITFFILLMRMLQLAVLDGQSYSAQATRQQEYVLDVATRRGILYDCKRRPLTYSAVGYRAVVEPVLFEGEERLLSILSTASDVSQEELRSKIEQKKPFAVKLNTRIDEEAGLHIVVTRERDVTSKMLTHLLGSAGADDELGLYGLEKSFDTFLASCSAKVTANVTLSAAGTQPEGVPVTFYSGKYYDESGVILTIDKSIQETCEAAADLYVPAGAIVVSDISTGEIKAMVSRPGYSLEDAGKLLASSGGEFINRALTPYDAGSVFKLIVTAAALENGSDIEKQQTTCTGAIMVGDKSFACHDDKGHGTLKLDVAFAQSCNPFFIELAEKLGLSPILEMAKRFGVTSKTTLAPDIVGATGSLPKDITPTPPALIANTSIGQGDVMLTPLDVLGVVATIANGGKKQPFSVVSGFLNPDGSYVKVEQKDDARQILSKPIANRISALMKETCISGTGKGAVPDGMLVAGKTASAQTGWKKNGEEVIHGWFAGFFPADNPKYAAVVIVENGRTGSQSAAPAFKMIAQSLVTPKAESNRGALSE